METLNMIQGSAEWLAHRATKFNASDAAAMMGCSPYKTRGELLRERATGIAPEIDEATQRRFDNGHKFEALARPLAEHIIGEPLSPVTGVNGQFSASFDGITFMEDICFEHKTLSDRIRAAKSASELPKDLRIQLEHQLHVSGARKCLFMASLWDGDELVEEIHHWYLPDLDSRQRIIAGWEQFEKDLAAYVPPVVDENLQAAAIMQLPALFVQVKGEVTGSNLVEFKDAASTFIANIKTELVTDQDFADAEANVKACKTAEDDLEGAKKAMLAQTSSIDEVMKTIDFIKAQLASKRLMLDKLVKSEKEARKLAIIDKARIAFNEHFTALEAEIKPVRLIAQHPDFGGAMKGLKKLSAMQDAVDTELANGKIGIDAIAKDVRAKLAWLQTESGASLERPFGYGFLFADLQAIIYKPLDDFKLLVKSRIESHKKDEAEKIERIRQEEEAKAEAKVKAAQEAKAKESAEKPKCDGNHGGPKCGDPECWNDTPSPEEVAHAAAPAAIAEAIAPRPAVLHAPTAVHQDQPKRPTRAEIVATIAVRFAVSEQTAAGWLCDEFQQQAA